MSIHKPFWEIYREEADQWKARALSAEAELTKLREAVMDYAGAINALAEDPLGPGLEHRRALIAKASESLHAILEGRGVR